MSFNLEVHETEARRIGEVIGDSDSPVGIDAKKTHVLILHKLHEIDRRLAALEDHLTSDSGVPL